jgi:hypothetical protein
LSIGFPCKVPKAIQTLQWVSVSGVIAIAATMAVFGALMVLATVCLIVGVIRVSDALTLLSTL